MSPPGNLVILDFTEDDTIDLLEDLLAKAKNGKVRGMVFSVMLSARGSERRVIIGSTGRAANNLIEATGLSALLHCRLTTAAMDAMQTN